MLHISCRKIILWSSREKLGTIEWLFRLQTEPRRGMAFWMVPHDKEEQCQSMFDVDWVFSFGNTLGFLTSHRTFQSYVSDLLPRGIFGVLWSSIAFRKGKPWFSKPSTHTHKFLFPTYKFCNNFAKLCFPVFQKYPYWQHEGLLFSLGFCL